MQLVYVFFRSGLRYKVGHLFHFISPTWMIPDMGRFLFQSTFWGEAAWGRLRFGGQHEFLLSSLFKSHLTILRKPNPINPHKSRHCMIKPLIISCAWSTANHSDHEQHATPMSPRPIGHSFYQNLGPKTLAFIQLTSLFPIFLHKLPMHRPPAFFDKSKSTSSCCREWPARFRNCWCTSVSGEFMSILGAKN